MMRTMILLLCLCVQGSAVEYFMAPQGKDANPGTREAPFKTIGGAAKVLKGGDTLTLLMGEYPPEKEKISLQGPVTIQGEHRNLSVITAWGDVGKLEWRPVSGQRFVYETDCGREIIGIIELNTRRILQKAPSVDDMEKFRGTYLYDSKNKKIYIHTSDGQAPENHQLKFTIHSGHLWVFDGADQLTVRNLTFCGSAHRTPRLSALAAAIRTFRTNKLVIENCNFEFNSGGVNITNECRDTIVRNSYFSRNISEGYSEMAQLFFGSKCRNSLAENNLIVDGATHGLRFYSRAENVSAVGNVIVGERIGLYYKASSGKRLAERNVVIGCDSFNYSDMGLPVTNSFNTFEKPSHIANPNESNLIFKRPKEDPKFCAPEIYDFRLRLDSPFLGKGAYPEAAPVVFASPGKLLEAAGQLKPGMTLYLNPGVYEEKLILKIQGPITVSGTTPQLPVELKGGIELTGCEDITVQYLKTADLKISSSKNINLKRVLVQGDFAAEKTGNIKIWRCTFDGKTNWSEVSGREIVLCRGIENDFSLENQPVAVGALDHPVKQPEALVDSIKIEALYPTLATIRWTTPNQQSNEWRLKDALWAVRPMMAVLEYGETPECKQKYYSLGEIFHSVNLLDLKPGTEYYYRIRIPKDAMVVGIAGLVAKAGKPGYAQELVTDIQRFTTPAELKLSPKTHRVSSIAEAGRIARPGDTVIIAPGIYQDTLCPQVSGLPGHPITFRAEKPGSVVLDGSEYLRPGGVYIEGCEYINVEGLVFQNFGNKLFSNRAGMEYGQAQLVNSKHISLKDNVFSGYGTYQYLVALKNVSDITIHNNLFCDGVAGIAGGHIGNLQVTNNTFYAPNIRNFQISSIRQGSTISVYDNLFIGQIRMKALAKASRGELDIMPKETATVNFDRNVWFFSPEDTFRFCGFEKASPAPEGVKFPAGLERLRKVRGFEKNGREISSLKLKNWEMVDPIDPDYYKKVIEPVNSGKFKFLLDTFDPVEGSEAGGAGARGK